MRKKSLSKGARTLRAIGSLIDPRAWLHLIRIVNYYNYSHVQPLREASIGRAPAISPDAVFSNASRIEIGDRARIGSRCHLWAGPGTGYIRIGNDVLMGPEVLLTAATYDYNAGSPITDQPMLEADIVVGNDVWFATRATVLPGAKVGDGAIIAANSVVRGEIPPNAIAAGSPAKVIGYRDIRLAEG